MIENTPQAWSERAKAPTSHEAALWSARGQTERFRAILDALNPRPGDTILDYGCGTGALSEFCSMDCYVGYDWATGMIRRARRDHRGYAFVRSLEPVQKFDLVACVGTFNLVHDWSKEQTWETIIQLWGRTLRALAVSLYAGADTDCMIYTRKDAFRFGQLPDAQLVSVTQPRPNDLLLLVER